MLSQKPKPTKLDVHAVRWSWGVHRKELQNNCSLATVIDELQQAVLVEGTRLRAMRVLWGFDPDPVDSTTLRVLFLASIRIPLIRSLATSHAGGFACRLMPKAIYVKLDVCELQSCHQHIVLSILSAIQRALAARKLTSLESWPSDHSLARSNTFIRQLRKLSTFGFHEHRYR